MIFNLVKMSKSLDFLSTITCSFKFFLVSFLSSVGIIFVEIPYYELSWCPILIRTCFTWSEVSRFLIFSRSRLDWWTYVEALFGFLVFEITWWGSYLIFSPFYKFEYVNKSSTIKFCVQLLTTKGPTLWGDLNVIGWLVLKKCLWSDLNLCLMYSKAYITAIKKEGSIYGSYSNTYTLSIIWFSSRYQSLVLVSGMSCKNFLNSRKILGGGQSIGT